MKNLSGPQFRASCKALLQDGLCPYKHKKDDYMEVGIPQESLDIEELVSVANHINKCAYYLNRKDMHSADLVLLPYQYLLTESIRKQMKIQLTGNIVIVDEAHNIGKAAEEALSMEISTR